MRNNQSIHQKINDILICSPMLDSFASVVGQVKRGVGQLTPQSQTHNFIVIILRCALNETRIQPERHNSASISNIRVAPPNIGSSFHIFLL